MNDYFSSNNTADASGSSAASFESSKQHALQAAEELRAMARDTARKMKEAATQKAHDFNEATAESAKHFKSYAEQSWQGTKNRADDWKTEGSHYVRENPAKAVLAALGVGIICGLFLRK